MTEIIVIAHNIRSIHNVGSIFRTCEGFGVTKLILSGYTPYPQLKNDIRLPHIVERLTKEIHKTALGAEMMVPFVYQSIPDLGSLQQAGYKVIALEQDPDAHVLPDYCPPEKGVLLLGEEVDGVPPDLLRQCDDIIEIPMTGQKESFNVSVAAGIALYALNYPTTSA